MMFRKTQEILSLLKRNARRTTTEIVKRKRVKFVIIGATAFPVHGYSRATLDIDIFIKAEEKTLAERLRH